MRILHVPAYFLPHTGGIESMVHNLAKESARKGHEVTVLSSRLGTEKEEEDVDGFTVKRIRSPVILKCPMPLGLLSALKKEDPDVIHLQFPHPYFMDVCAQYAKKHSIPSLLSCHAEFEMRGLMGLAAKIYNATLFSRSLSGVDTIVTSTKKIVMQSPHVRAHSGKAQVIPLGVDVSRFRPDRKTKLREELGLNDRKIVLFVGVLRPYKGAEYLVRAMKSVISEDKDAVLIIVGKGEEKERLESLSRSLGISGSVIFAGFVPDSRMAEYYSIADVFVLPSPTIEESFGLVALEAMACGAPAIATSGAGVSEVFEKEKIGVVAKPRDAEDLAEKILALLSDRKKSMRMGEKARSVMVKKYSWPRITERFIKAYDEIS